jgi:hypothetical protein
MTNHLAANIHPYLLSSSQYPCISFSERSKRKSLTNQTFGQKNDQRFKCCSSDDTEPLDSLRKAEKVKTLKTCVAFWQF